MPGWRNTRGSTSIFTPTSGSWLNLVEVWFGIIDRQAIHRGIFTSVKDPNAKIRQLITGWNDRKHPFVGHTITIRYDPRDIFEIRVYDRDTFICTAIDEAHPQPSPEPSRHRNRTPSSPQATAKRHQRSHPNRCGPRGTSRRRTDEAAAEAAHLRRGRVMNQTFIVAK